MGWIKRLAIGGAAVFAILMVIGALVPERYREQAKRDAQAAAKPPSPRIEDGVAGKLATFASVPGSEPATLTIGCKNGRVADLMLNLDVAPVSPPPLRGVFGQFSFKQEPRQRIELGWLSKGFWTPREGQEGDVRAIARRFMAGETLSFTLDHPNGSGDAITWTAPPRLSVPDCKA